MDYFEGYNEQKIRYCHGIMVDRLFQGLGASRKMIDYLVFKAKPDILTAKTPNMKKG